MKNRYILLISRIHRTIVILYIICPLFKQKIKDFWRLRFSYGTQHVLQNVCTFNKLHIQQTGCSLVCLLVVLLSPPNNNRRVPFWSVLFLSSVWNMKHLGYLGYSLYNFFVQLFLFIYSIQYIGYAVCILLYIGYTLENK